jgi:folate-dependent phosphoribosylglycinamide formyltransferase PurN
MKDGRLPMLNILPSLLPAFPGMGALAPARAARVAYFGATLHGMTMRLDAGPIVAHDESHREPDEPLERMEKKSFVHKLYLILLAIDLLERGRLRFVDGLPVCDPGELLENPRYRSHVESIEQLKGVLLS